MGVKSPKLFRENTHDVSNLNVLHMTECNHTRADGDDDEAADGEMDETESGSTA